MGSAAPSNTIPHPCARGSSFLDLALWFLPLLKGAQGSETLGGARPLSAHLLLFLFLLFLPGRQPQVQEGLPALHERALRRQPLLV